ncbi:MAG: AI-2E family transporter [Ruminococcaceae bacterium]|nr:AI-2E family transporter [Oscillospiraceae bacterium]
MKFEHNKKYGQIAFYACLVILFAIICIFFFLKVDVGGIFKKIFAVLKPILYGIIIAYILNRIVKFFETKIFAFLDKKKGRLKLKRSLSVIFTYVSVILLLSGFVLIIGPQVVAGINDLRDNISFYVSSIQGWLLDFGTKVPELAGIIDKAIASLGSLLTGISAVIEYIVPKLTGIISDVIVLIKDVALGIILSIYFLLQKEKFVAQGKRLVCALFSERKYNKLVSAAKQADDSFGGYIVAMAFDSVLVGLECFVVCSIVGIPYYPLVSLVVGVTNFIPFFGPFIGAIPSAIIIFIADPISVVWFAIIILVIQQIDGNIIAPKIIGNHLNLSSVWVVIAITIMSGLFGFVGMVIGVPMFSLIYTWFGNIISGKLKNKSRSSDILDYYSDGVGKELEIERIQAEEWKENRPSIFARIKTMFVWVVEHDHDVEMSEHGEELVEDYLEEIDREEPADEEPSEEKVPAEKEKRKDLF